MIYIIVILLIVVSSSVLSHADKANESEHLVNRITDCFYINNNNNSEAVELVCDGIDGNYPKDNCYSTLFKGATQQINRSKVKSLKSGQCRSKTLNESQFHEMANQFPNLRDLNLAFLGTNNVDYYRISSNYFPNLKVLNMSHNRFGFENDNANRFSRICGNFDVIDISFNYLNDCQIHFEGNITHLNLSYNSISYIAAWLLSYIRQLRVLDLRNNKIAYLDESVFGTVYDTLEEIHLQNNQFMRFVNNYKSLPRTLAHLNLSQNRIEDYNHIWISDLRKNLRYLDLSHNNIQHIVVNFESGEMLKSLDISYNGLRTFKYIHNDSKVLEELNLEGNDLYQLESITPLIFPNLTSISISKNRFDCEYAEKFVQQWKGVKVIGDVCDQKRDEPPPSPPVPYVIIILLGCSTVIASIWIVRSKLLDKKKQEIVGQKNVVQCRSSDEYEEPLPHVEPIYHEIDYSETLPPNSSHANKQYDHLTRDPMPLSPIRLHYDNVSKCNREPSHVR